MVDRPPINTERFQPERWSTKHEWDQPVHGTSKMMDSVGTFGAGIARAAGLPERRRIVCSRIVRIDWGISSQVNPMYAIAPAATTTASFHTVGVDGNNR